MPIRVFASYLTKIGQNISLIRLKTVWNAFLSSYLLFFVLMNRLMKYEYCIAPYKFYQTLNL